MKLTSIELLPDGSSTPLIFSFRDPRALNPYTIKSVQGLDTDGIIPKYYGSDAESKLYNLFIQKRTIVLQTGLNPDYATDQTFSELRDAIYRVIASSRTGKIQLKFKDGIFVVAVTSGSVSKVEANLFEQSQEILLTLECDESMLKSPTPVQFDVINLDPNSSVLEDTRSTAPHGFSFVLGVKDIPDTLSFLNIKNQALGFSFIIRPSIRFIRNDELHFSSEFNNKYLYLVRDGETIHLADELDLNSVWPFLFPGINELQVNAAASIFWKEISHYETYWGV